MIVDTATHSANNSQLGTLDSQLDVSLRPSRLFFATIAVKGFCRDQSAPFSTHFVVKGFLRDLGGLPLSPLRLRAFPNCLLATQSSQLKTSGGNTPDTRLPQNRNADLY